MRAFYCRDDELRKLNKRYEGGRFECIVIYGRRRVGKTALINEFCKDKPTIFFSALNTTGKENLEALSKAIMSFDEYSCAGVPLFRRNGYRQSGARKPLFQNRDTAPNCLLPASLLA